MVPRRQTRVERRTHRRQTLALRIVFAACVALPLSAQESRLATSSTVGARPLFERSASLDVENVALVDALRSLERRAGVPLAYSPSLLPATRVDCECHTSTVREALTTLLAGTGFIANEMVGQIVIVPDPTAPRPATIDSTTITGTVTSEAGAPIGGAFVTATRLRLSTVTNDAGVFRLYVPPDRFVAQPETLRVTRLGFRPATAPFTLASGQVTVNVVMASQVIALQQVVVTGTAGNQERRAQAALVATIDAADIVRNAPVLDVNELLTARNPGISLTKASGASGSNTRIDIRGQASISLSNYPLVFIDGVRVVAGPRSVVQAPGGTTAGAGGQMLNALNDLNPDDIESIEIVKGPAASTLYGSDASAGVIQILTKKGRAGTQRFSQRLSLEYDEIDPNFTPRTNYGKCTAALVAASSPNPLCRGQSVGTVVSDNVLVRNNVFDNGNAKAFTYAAQGGGDTFGYYASFSADDEEGTAVGSALNHRSGRVNANWTAGPKLSMDVSLNLVRAKDKLAQGDQSAYGFLIGGDFGSPLSVTSPAGGGLAGGWFNNNLNVQAISAIRTEDLTMRSTPSVQMRYVPFPGFTHRFTIGGDFIRTTASQMYPKNSNNWYSATLNTGSLAVSERNSNVYTVDYLANVNRRFGDGGWISADLSFGSQWINTTGTSVTGTGLGLLTNSNNLLSAATTTTATQGYEQSKSLGFFGQAQIGFRDRLFLQLGTRVDRNSAFGSEVGSFILPKAGLSYVMSDESYWQPLASIIPTFRLRAAYGTTGRSPTGTSSLQTYSRSNYVTDLGLIQPGVSPGNPGNAALEPERGEEFEAGFDAGFFRDRAGVEVTYFAKHSRDLLLTLPLPPSSGFTSNPLVNIGEVTNKGLEVAFRATPIDGRTLSWDAGINFSTLANKIVSMGNITPFVSANNQCFKPGVEVAAWCVPRVLSVDTTAGRSIVSDTAQLAGGQLPKYTASFNTTVTLFRAFRVHAQLDGKWDYHIYDLTSDFRDRSIGNSGLANLPADQGGFSTYERLRRYGPFRTQTSGSAVGFALVRDPYIVPGDFVRFRELSLTWSVPASLSQRLRLAGTSISVGGRNLGLWSDYPGWDPEVMGTVDVGTPNLADVFTLPQTRRTFARITIEF
jgi:TonB-linked SusC/RagA family outer membrane protein